MQFPMVHPPITKYKNAIIRGLQLPHAKEREHVETSLLLKCIYEKAMRRRFRPFS